MSGVVKLKDMTILKITKFHAYSTPYMNSYAAAYKKNIKASMSPINLVLHPSIREGGREKGRREGAQGREGQGVHKTEQVWVLMRGKEEDW